MQRFCVIEINQVMIIHNYTADFKRESCGTHIKINFNGFVETHKERTGVQKFNGLLNHKLLMNRGKYNLAFI